MVRAKKKYCKAMVTAKNKSCKARIPDNCLSFEALKSSNDFCVTNVLPISVVVGISAAFISIPWADGADSTAAHANAKAAREDSWMGESRTAPGKAKLK